jgi:hypothetical protein
MTVDEAIDILENKTGYAIIDAETTQSDVLEAVHMALDALKNQSKN